MPEHDPIATFVAPLEHLGLAYCITGSVAASVYGEPRLTADIDVVIVLRVSELDALRNLFPDTEFYVPPNETLRLQLARPSRGMFNLIHHATQFKADLYLAVQDPLHAWALANRRRVDLGVVSGWIAPPEYVILRKLEFYREGGSDKHLRDVRFMLRNTTVDSEFLETEVARLGLGTQWRLCRDTSD
jgi:hypothetical protein